MCQLMNLTNDDEFNSIRLRKKITHGWLYYVVIRVLEDRIQILLDLDPFLGGLYRIVDPFFPEDRDWIVDPKNQGLDRKGSDFFQILFSENITQWEAGNSNP